MPNNKTRSTLLLAALLARALTAGASTVESTQLADMSLEELNDIVVTSVSRQEERLSNAAASVFIISNEDIRRSGVRSLPEALRLAPNLQVAQVDARNYAITARGFGSALENKLLVLIDGRSIYSPLFSGVFWDAQDMVMEDVERIEVISGPGATIWGVNAVNGVINIITRSATDTQGTLASLAAGSNNRDGSARYGGALPNGGHFRLYARYADADDIGEGKTMSDFTGWHRRQAGFRADWERMGLAVSGDVYQGKLHQLGTRDIDISGGNLNTRYVHKLSADSDLSVQVVLDHTERDQPNAYIDRLDTYELQAQHSVRLARNSIVWGGGYRESRDTNIAGPGFGFLPGDLTMHWGNLFVQDEYALTPQLRLTAGAKVEHNNYTGAEWLPSARLAWMPDSGRLLWASLARTVRAPSRIDRDFYAPPVPVKIGGVPRYLYGGGPDFDSEVAKVAELGYRAQPSPRWSYSATLWYADYDRLRTLEPNPLPLPNTGLNVFRNLSAGYTRGLEVWGSFQATPHWRLHAGLVVQNVEIKGLPGSKDMAAAAGLNANDPNSRWMLRSSHDLPANMQLDWTLRRVGKLPHPEVPSYHELDMHLSWKASANMEFALIGQNLLHRNHAEYGALPGRSVIERTAMLQMTLRY